MGEARGDNSMLVALSCLERIVPLLKAESRVQLGRQTMIALNQIISQTLENVMGSGFQDDLVVAPLVAVTRLLDDVLSDENIVQTDEETKSLVTVKLLDCLELFYVKVGQFYEAHDFNYSKRLDLILQRIVNKCLESGYYFGLDAELQGEGIS